MTHCRRSLVIDCLVSGGPQRRIRLAACGSAVRELPLQQLLGYYAAVDILPPVPATDSKPHAPPEKILSKGE